MNLISIVSQLPRHPTLRYRDRPLTAIDGISVHHSADEGNPWSWAQYHIKPAAEGGPPWTPDGLGAPGICYHAAVMRDGRAYKLQLDRTQCWHTADHNGHTLGIVFQGHLGRLPPTEAQIASGLWVVRQYMRAYPAIVAPNIRGHGEWNPGATECPGTWLAQALRAALAAA